MDDQSGPARTVKPASKNEVTTGQDKSVLQPAMQSSQGEFADDLMETAAVIAEYFYRDRSKYRAVYHLRRTSRIPFFTIGSRLCLRKSSFIAWVKAQEDRNSGGTPSGLKPWMTELTSQEQQQP